MQLVIYIFEETAKNVQIGVKVRGPADYSEWREGLFNSCKFYINIIYDDTGARYGFPRALYFGHGVYIYIAIYNLNRCSPTIEKLAS